jgi:hypothetical protein
MIKGSGTVALEPLICRTCVVAGEDLNLRPLGYEQADPRLIHPTVAITPQATLGRRRAERRSVSPVAAGIAAS